MTTAPTFNGLSLDLNLCILCRLNDFDSLCTVLQSSKSYFEAFQCYPRKVLLSIEDHERLCGRSPYISDALALVSSMGLRLPSTISADVSAFITHYSNCSTSEWIDVLISSQPNTDNVTGADKLSCETVRQLLCHNSCVRTYARLFDRRKLASVGDQTPPLPVSKPATTTELSRISQAFYRLWIYCRLFYAREPYSTFKERGFTIFAMPAEEEQLRFITGFPTIWDAEAIRCAYLFVHEMLNGPVTEFGWSKWYSQPTSIDEELMREDPDDDEFTIGFPNHWLPKYGLDGVFRLLYHTSNSEREQIFRDEVLALGTRCCNTTFGEGLTVDDDGENGFRYLPFETGGKEDENTPAPIRRVCNWQDVPALPGWERQPGLVNFDMCIWDEWRLEEWGFYSPIPVSESPEGESP